MTLTTCNHDKDLTCGCGANWTCTVCEAFMIDLTCACNPQPKEEATHDPTTCPVCLKMLTRICNGEYDGVSGKAVRVAIDLAHLGKGAKA